MLRKKWRKWMFSAIFLLIVASLFCISTIAATTVKPISGVEVTDSGGTGTLSGEIVTITATGGYTSRTTNTVTITNASESAATLSFDYSVTGNYNSFSTPSGNKSGTYTDTLPAGGTVEIKIESKALKMTATLKLSNFSLTATAASSIVGFAYDTTLGSVTVDGTGIVSGASVEINGTTGAALVATPVSGATFVGWIDASNNKLISTSATYTLIPAENMSVQAAFSNASANAWFWVPDGSDKYLYNNLNTACTKASFTSDKTVILAANGTLPALDNNQSYTIPSGVTLLIPYNSAHTLHTTKPATTDATHVTPSAYRTLTMASGANLTVKGSLSLSGTVSAKFGSNGRPHGPLGYIKMNSGSSITVDGNLYAWGYIYGSGSVTVNSGATVYECFQIMDYRGGDGTTQVVNKKDTYHVFPMSQYYVQNIEVPLTLHAGAKEYGFMAVTVTLAGIQTAEVPFIGASGESVMFQVSKGYLTKDYDETADRLIVDVYGDVNLNSYSISIKVSLVGSITIDSADYVLPVTQNLTVNVKSGSNLAISQDIALLPEAEVNIEEGAKCTLASGKKIVVYDLDDWAGYCGSTSMPFFSLPYAPGRAKPTVSVRGKLTKDATLLVNGTLDVSEGALYTTAAGANICSTGAGKIIFAPGTETVVYQAEQSNTDVTGWPAISIVPAWLNHGDGSYLKTGETGNGAGTYYYNKDHKKWVKDGHIFDEGVVTTAPTCTATGTKTYTCKCGYTKTETVAAIDHSYDSVVMAPTCSEGGYTMYTCTLCGDTYTDSEVAATGHSYTSKVTTEATCETTGVETFTCHCGESYTQEIPLKNHSWSNWDEASSVFTTTCEHGCNQTIKLTLEYRVSDYVWLNAFVQGPAEMTLTTNEYTLQPINGDYYLVRKINAKELPIKFTVQFTALGANTPSGENALEISFATYKSIKEAEYVVREAELKAQEDAGGLTTEEQEKITAERAKITAYRNLFTAMEAYGKAAQTYFGRKDVDPVDKPAAMANHSSTLDSVSNTRGTLNGVYIATKGVNFSFDECITMTMSFALNGGKTMSDLGTITQVGLLVGDSATGKLLTTNEGDYSAAYLLYSLAGLSGPDGSVPGAPNFTPGTHSTITKTELESKSAWTISFDLASKELYTKYALRLFIVVDNTPDNATDDDFSVLYGTQYHYGLADYLVRTYNGTVPEGYYVNAYNNLMIATWNYMVAAKAAF